MIEYTEFVIMRKLGWDCPKVFIEITKDGTIIKMDIADFTHALQVEFEHSTKCLISETQPSKTRRKMLLWLLNKILGVKKPLLKIVDSPVEPIIEKILKELREAPHIAMQERG